MLKHNVLFTQFNDDLQTESDYILKIMSVLLGSLFVTLIIFLRFVEPRGRGYIHVRSTSNFIYILKVGYTIYFTICLNKKEFGTLILAMTPQYGTQVYLYKSVSIQNTLNYVN